MNLTVCTLSHSSLLPSIPVFCACNFPHKRKQKIKKSPFPSYSLSILANSPKTKTHKCCQWKLQCIMVCHTVDPFAQIAFLANICCQYWVLTRSSLRYPVVALYNGDQLALILQDKRTPAVHVWDGCWGRPTQNSESGPEW